MLQKEPSRPIMTGPAPIDEIGLPAGPWAICPYCGGAAMDPSLEHVVSVSIGGQGLPVIQGVCAECNSSVNRIVDVPLAADRHVYAERMRLGIEGRRGAPAGRNLEVLEVEALGPGERVVKHRVAIREEPGGISGIGLVSRTEGSGWLVVTGSTPEEVARQGDKERRRLRAAGKQFTERLDEGVVELVVPYRLPLMGEGTYDKATAKMALGLVPRVFGEAWSRSGVAYLLRAILYAKSDEDRKAVKLGRQIFPIEAAWAQQFEFPDLHVLAVVPGESARGQDHSLLVASLFGRTIGVVKVSDHGLAPEQCPVVLIDPIEKTSRLLSLPSFMDVSDVLRARLEERAERHER